MEVSSPPGGVRRDLSAEWSKRRSIEYTMFGGGQRTLLLFALLTSNWVSPISGS